MIFIVLVLSLLRVEVWVLLRDGCSLQHVLRSCLMITFQSTVGERVEVFTFSKKL